MFCWLGRQGSNLGMQAPKARALPLGYAPDVINKLRNFDAHRRGFLPGTSALACEPFSYADAWSSSPSEPLRGFPAATAFSSSSYAANTAFSIFSRIELLIG